MAVVIIGIVAILTGFYAFRTRERSLESQQRFYEIVFGRRLKIANMTTHLFFVVLVEIFGLLMVIVGIKRLL